MAISCEKKTEYIFQVRVFHNEFIGWVPARDTFGVLEILIR